MRLSYIIILTLISINAIGQPGFILKEQHSDSVSNKLDSILIIGEGSVETEIFLDGLSKTLLKSFMEKQVKATYHFLGSEFNGNYDSVNKQGYKAILFLLPRGASSLDLGGSLNHTTIHTTRGSIPVIFPTSRSQYEQAFTFQLCYPNDRTIVWQAAVQVSCNIRKNKEANRVANKLISTFKNRKYI